MATTWTPIVRILYPHVHRPTPKQKGSDVLVYNAVLLFPKDLRKAYEALKLPEHLIVKSLDRMDEMKKVAASTAIEFFGSKDKVPVAIKHMDLAKGSGWPFRDQKDKIDPDRADNAPYEEGGLFLTPYSTKKPEVVDRKRMPVDEEDFYSGCWGIASLTCKGYDESGNRGVSFYLNNLQKICDDSRVGGRSTAAQDFDDIEDFGDTASSADSLF